MSARVEERAGDSCCSACVDICHDGHRCAEKPKGDLISAARPRPARRARSRSTGRSPSRSWTRSVSPTAPSSRTLARVAGGSRFGSRTASDERARVGRGHPAEDDEAIGRRVRRENLANVRTVLGIAKDPRLPRGLDAVLIFGAYHEIEDPVTLLKNVARSLKPQGRIGVVDFNPGGGGPGPRPTSASIRGR